MSGQDRKIRPARTTEAGDVALMVCRFAAEIVPDYPPHVPTVTASVSALISSARGFVSVLEGDGRLDGFLLGQAMPSPWIPALVAEEMCWWIAPGARGQFGAAMISEFEGWAGEIGARVVGMSWTGKSMARFLQRRGYEPAESRMIRYL